MHSMQDQAAKRLSCRGHKMLKLFPRRLLLSWSPIQPQLSLDRWKITSTRSTTSCPAFLSKVEEVLSGQGPVVYFAVSAAGQA
jgi:hypothetical protein